MPDDRLVGREAGIGADDLVTGSGQGIDRVKKESLCSRGHDHLLRAEAEPPQGAGCIGDGLAQCGESLGWAIAGVPLLKGPNGGLPDVGGSRKVGLADFKVDDIDPACLKLLRASQDVECRFTSQLSCALVQHGSMIAPPAALYT